MWYNEFEPSSWMKFPENQCENYNAGTYEGTLRNMGSRKWLASLPMFEYAHVLTLITAMRCGGDPDKYYDDLFVLRLCPVLDLYHRRLGKYRYMRALLMRNYDSLRDKINDTTMSAEMREMKAYAKKVRAKLRQICNDFENQTLGRQ